MIYMLYAFVSAFFTACATIFLKLGLRSVNPLFTATIQTTIAALFLLALFFGKSGHTNYRFDLPGLLFITFAGIAAALSWLFYIQALNLGPATQVAAIERTNILFIVVLCVLVLGECWHMKYLVGALLIVFGASLITL